MQKKRLLPLLFFLVIFMMTGCGYAGPEKAVRQEMELIRELDESTIKAFVSYENIRISGASSQEIGDETTEAVKLFFQNFKYRIRSSSVSEDSNSATVVVDITNIDAVQLAKDLCTKMITDSVTREGNGEQEGLAFSFTLMKECLETNEYPLVTTQATVSLTKQDGLWAIQESSQLEDELTGGLVSSLNDPYLLTPADVLEATFSPFREFTAEQWQTYLELDDIFGTGTSQAGEIDLAVAAQLAAHFDFEVGDVTQDEDSASARVTIRSFDLSGILEKCRASLLEYAKTTESIRATDEELSEKISAILLEALQENTQSTDSTVLVSLSNNGYIWEVLLDDSFSDALLGGVGVATDTFLSALAENETESIEETENPETETVSG